MGFRHEICGIKTSVLLSNWSKIKYYAIKQSVNAIDICKKTKQMSTYSQVFSCLGSALIRLALAVVWSTSKTIGPIKVPGSLAEQSVRKDKTQKLLGLPGAMWEQTKREVTGIRK